MKVLCAVVVVAMLVGIANAALPVVDIITGYGYPATTFTVTTPDGYNLILIRIPNGVKNVGPRKGVVFLQHGVTDNANGWVVNSPSESLPFILADSGYDVWLGNNRGNGISMSSTQYATDTSQFWDFSFDEMGEYDLPTQLRFVTKTTGVAQVTYIGHSQGTVQAFAGFENATTASMVNLFIAMAPIAFIYHERAQIPRVLSYLHTAVILELLGDKEFYIPNVLDKLVPDACKIDPHACDFMIEFIAGPSTNLNESRLAYYATIEPNPTSIVNMVHWSQLVAANKFQKFDYGSSGNIAHYGQSTPPQYDLGKVTLPVALFTGTNDYLADPSDVEVLKQQLGRKPVFELNEATYAHVDFLYAPDAKDLIYPSVLKLIQQYGGK